MVAVTQADPLTSIWWAIGGSPLTAWSRGYMNGPSPTCTWGSQDPYMEARNK